MTVEYVTLPSGRADWKRYKCFYHHDGHYAEFFINVNPSQHQIRFECKDPWYEAVLTQAFAKTMSEF